MTALLLQAFVLISRIHVDLIFVYGVRHEVKFIASPCRELFIPVQLTEPAILSPVELLRFFDRKSIGYIGAGLSGLLCSTEVCTFHYQYHSVLITIAL